MRRAEPCRVENGASTQHSDDDVELVFVGGWLPSVLGPNDEAHVTRTHSRGAANETGIRIRMEYGVRKVRRDFCAVNVRSVPVIVVFEVPPVWNWWDASA